MMLCGSAKARSTLSPIVTDTFLAFGAQSDGVGILCLAFISSQGRDCMGAAGGEVVEC